MKRIINVLIIDDHPIIVSAYERILNTCSLDNESNRFNICSMYSIESVVQKIENYNSKYLFDLVLLDINLPPYREYGIGSGEGLGEYLKMKIPSIKIIVITALNDNLRLSNILTNLNPDGFLIKSEITSEILLQAVRTIISGHTFYCKIICDQLRGKVINNIVLDSLDIDILKELSNASKMTEMLKIIPLSKSGIEKRKRLLKEKFQTKNDSDRELVIMAKEKGFI